MDNELNKIKEAIILLAKQIENIYLQQNPTVESYCLINEIQKLVEPHCVVPKRWKPKVGEQYYYIHESGIPTIDTWEDDYHHKYKFNLGNCFKTEVDARFCLDEFIKKAFDEWHEQYPPGSPRG